jgi:FAD-linked sulfhydryl oxidase
MCGPALTLSRCRACNTKSAFSAFAAQATHKQSKTTTSPAATQGATTTNKNPAVECPPDVAQLGRSSWTLLHSIAAQYPETPSNAQQSDLVSFVRLFSRLYPCWVCADDFQAYIARDAPRVASRDEFGQWLCRAHNNVNVKLGKPVFDCARWEERWRTGPPDGSCD